MLINLPLALDRVIAQVNKNQYQDFLYIYLFLDETQGQVSGKTKGELGIAKPQFVGKFFLFAVVFVTEDPTFIQSYEMKLYNLPLDF